MRVITDSSGIETSQQGHLPFGESWYSSGTSSKWDFTSYENDSESSLNYAMFRYDSSHLGRFMTPDPIAGSIFSPQTLNRFSYVNNDPINLIDPLGLDDECYWDGEKFVCFVDEESAGEDEEEEEEKEPPGPRPTPPPPPKDPMGPTEGPGPGGRACFRTGTTPTYR